MKRKTLSIIISAASSLLALVVVLVLINTDPQNPSDSGWRSEPQESSRVCRDNYERIETGMDYEEVQSILGRHHRFSKAQMFGVDCKEFVWFGPNRVAVIVYMLKGHVLSTKYEEGYSG